MKPIKNIYLKLNQRKIKNVVENELMLKKKVYDSGKTFWVLFFNYFLVSIFIKNCNNIFGTEYLLCY